MQHEIISAAARSPKGPIERDRERQARHGDVQLSSRCAAGLGLRGCHSWCVLLRTAILMKCGNVGKSCLVRPLRSTNMPYGDNFCASNLKTWLVKDIVAPLVTFRVPGAGNAGAHAHFPPSPQNLVWKRARRSTCYFA